MERVDVVVVGGEPEALAAACAAAAGGVRVILIRSPHPPRPSDTLYALRTMELEAMHLAAGARTFECVELNGRPPARFSHELAFVSVERGSLDQQLVARAQEAGTLVREGADVVHADLDTDGWRLVLSAGEPIRAPILIVADGARSRMLETLGIAQAQRFTASLAEVITFLCATWRVGSDKARSHDAFKVLEYAGPIGRIEMLAGADTLTVAFGPLWRGVAQDAPFDRDLDVLIETVGRRLLLEGRPSSVAFEEWRLDALPIPATFDGGIVVGAAAGHRPHEPLTAFGPLIASGRHAGAAAAACILSSNLSASALARALGPSYRELSEIPGAQLQWAARGLRRPAPPSAEAWRASIATK